MIAWVDIVLNRTVVVDNDCCFDNQWGSNLPSQSELHDISCMVLYTLWKLHYPVDSILLLLNNWDQCGLH